MLEAKMLRNTQSDRLIDKSRQFILYTHNEHIPTFHLNIATTKLGMLEIFMHSQAHTHKITHAHTHRQQN